MKLLTLLNYNQKLIWRNKFIDVSTCSTLEM